MDKIAVNRRTALKMAWDAGMTSEDSLKRFNDALTSVKQCTAGYWYAQDVICELERIGGGLK